MQSNILVFVLDSQGQYVHSFDAMTDQHPAPIHQLKKRMPGYFVQELNKAGKTLNLPTTTAASRTASLPTAATPGVRIYVSLGENRLNHFAVPVVEAVSFDKTELESLSYRNSKQTLEAPVFRRWLAQMYPPAVMDGHGGMEKVTGSLTYSPAGENATHRYAVVRGTVRFQLDNTSKISYTGPVDLVLRYTKQGDQLESVWGTMTTKIPRHGPQGRIEEMVPMTVAIEPITAPKEDTGR